MATDRALAQPDMAIKQDDQDSSERYHLKEGRQFVPAMQQVFRDRERGPSMQGAPQAGFMYTPPEDINHSFSTSETATAVKWHTKLPPLQVGPSPPTSPSMARLPSLDSVVSQDGLLYPHAEQTSQSQEPLFVSDAHISPRPRSRNDSAAEVVPDPNRNVGGLVGGPMNLPYTEESVNKYYQDRLRELERYREARQLPAPTKSQASERDVVSRSQVAALRPRPAGITKPKPKSPLKPKAPKAVKATPPPAKKRATPSRRATPKAKTLQDFHDAAFPAESAGAKHKRAPPSKKGPAKEEDVRWRQIPDYTAPVSSLDDAPRALKAEWNGPQPLDISELPDVDELAPAEYAMASELRLPPQQYLANKRRLFGRRLQYLKMGKNFTKTAAQGACNVDVNKASKLWLAFERVGWFDEKWFTPKFDDVTLDFLEKNFKLDKQG